LLKIGITGSIGSGKTTVCRILETLHVPVYYADERGKYLQQNNKKVISQVRSAFGDRVYGPGNVLDRSALSGIVFNDPDKLAVLESIVHPAVFQDFNEWVSKQNTPYIIKEAALLFEAGTNKNLDKMITVTAPLEVRIQRVLLRDHLSREQVQARMNRQWTDERKIKEADYVIYNDDRQLLLPQVLRLHEMFVAGRT